MEAYFVYLNELINSNKTNFSLYPNINWINPYQSAGLIEKREQLLEKVGEDWLFKKTKPFFNQISKGCSLCGQGLWSCLFITNKCNGACFYCPAAQNMDIVPSSQQLTFETPEAYAEYVNHFGFKGVSFSGGEPLLYFKQTLAYLQSVRKSCDPEIYTWLYTNGILGSPAKFQKLAAAGLDEVRFDIGATAYKLNRILPAKNTVPNITIEIPAVPEELETIIALLPEMVKMGVTNLNLHQLRLTTHNAVKLLKRNYTYIPSERPVVLESEIASLEIMHHAKANGLKIGVNYCSFDYKFRFQKAGYRKLVAAKLAGDELITENGYIRKYDKTSLNYEGILLTDGDNAPLQNADSLTLHKKAYKVTRASAIMEIPINAINQKPIEALFAGSSENIPTDETLFKIWQHEFIEEGLRGDF